MVSEWSRGLLGVLTPQGVALGVFLVWVLAAYGYPMGGPSSFYTTADPPVRTRARTGGSVTMIQNIFINIAYVREYA